MPVPSERMMGNEPKPTLAQRARVAAQATVGAQVNLVSMVLGYVLAFGTVLLARALGF